MEEKINVNLEAVQAENEMLKKQLQNAYAQLREKDTAVMLRRLDFLFNVLDKKECFDSDFVITVSDEIKECLYPSKDNSENNQEE